MTEDRSNHWPTLPVVDWADTVEVVHLWTQIVGKIRLVYSPWLNHSWSVPLYVSTRGLRTSVIPYGTDAVELEFDFGAHELLVHTTTGQRASIPLQTGSVSDFYQQVVDAMVGVGMPVSINTMPNEIPDAIPFDQDTAVRSYDPGHANALWRALVHADRVLTRFRADFKGKASPVHFFWGSFDLATSRFSGRSAPPHPGGMPNFPDDVAREAYSEELTSAGFWPGNRADPNPIFYAYAYPTPDGFSESSIEPAEATWLDDLGEFALRYEAVAAASDPDATLASFFGTAHAAAAELAGWNRADLECDHPEGPDWWRNRPHESD